MIKNIDGKTQLFPIIGDPIIYVKSPELLTQSFWEIGFNGVCIPMRIPEEGYEVAMAGLAQVPNIGGLLVTMPYKFSSFSYCATYSERTKLLNVVSVMRRNTDGSWHGDVLDGLAFVKAQIEQGAQLKGARALLLGAGGAGSAIAIALVRSGIKELILYDPDSERLGNLVKLVTDLSECRISTGQPDPTGCDLVFNATSMGMAVDDPLPVSPKSLTSSMFVGDVIAGHGETPLLAAARAVGCNTANGDQMVEAVQELMVEFMLGNV